MPSLGGTEPVEPAESRRPSSVGGDGHCNCRLTRVLHGGTYLMGDGWLLPDEDEEKEEAVEAAEEAEETEKERDFSDRYLGVCMGLAETQGGGVSFPPIV